MAGGGEAGPTVPPRLRPTHAGCGTLHMAPVVMNLGLVRGVAATLAHETRQEFDRREVVGCRRVVRVPKRRASWAGRGAQASTSLLLMA
jgi:hypothetical protein